MLKRFSRSSSSKSKDSEASRLVITIPGAILWWGLVGLSTVLLAGAAHWRLAEFDAFLYARAGSDIWKTGHLQALDTWTYTALGHPWHNLQWLSSIIIYLTSRLHEGYYFLPTLRATLVGALVVALWRLCRQQARDRFDSAFVALFIVTLVFIVSVPRIQMRGELFAFPIFAALLGARSLWTSLALLVLWANVHAGSAPIGIAIFALRAATERRPWLAAAGALTILATPVGTGAFGQIAQLALLRTPHLRSSVDHAPLAFADLASWNRPQGLYLEAWLILTALAGVVLVWPGRLSEKPAGPYQSKLFCRLGALLLTALALFRARALPYQAVFIAPLAFAFAWQKAQCAKRLTALGAVALLAVYLPIHLAHIGPKGFGLAKSLFPTGSAEFLRRTHPRPQLYNDRYYGWGNYLIDALPEYPVSVDSREDLMAEYWKQYAEVDQPERQAAFLDRLGANIALMPLPREGGFASATALRRWYPVEQWALVYFENNAVVLVRRIPEHAKLIAEHEYVHLVPGQRPAQMRSDALPELERCLAETPENIHCLYSKANLLIEEGRRSEARVYLERAAQWQKHL